MSARNNTQNPFITGWNKLNDFLDHRETTLINRHKLYVLFYHTLCIEIVALFGVFFSNVNFPRSIVAVVACYVPLVPVPLILYYYRKLNISTALSILFYSSHLMISLQYIYFALQPPTFLYAEVDAACAAYLLPLLINVLLSIVAHQKYDPIIQAVLALGMWAFYAFYTGDVWPIRWLFLIAPFFLVPGFMGHRLVNSTILIDKQNKDLKEGEERLYALFKVKKDQVEAYMKLSEEEWAEKSGNKDDIFDFFEDKAKQNIVRNVKKYLDDKEMTDEIIKQRLPILTPSERAVARLVMMDKKLTDICTILKKTESNVTTTRAHIRKKMGLRTEDDLKQALLDRMNVD